MSDMRNGKQCEKKMLEQDCLPVQSCFATIDIPEDSIRNSSPELLEILLKDKTTGKNIIWATTDYEENGEGFGAQDEMTIETVTNKFGKVIQPRAAKDKEIQLMRIRKKGEVFTPSWMCNVQNNEIDKLWFGREVVFNTLIDNDHDWIPTEGKISFDGVPDGQTWQDYVKELRLEITCGEAPYLVSWYDTTTGKEIPLEKRIGMFDRKMRIVNEQCEADKNEWIKWSLFAIKSVYGFEFQGDSLLIARENMFRSYCDYYQKHFRREPTKTLLKQVANIIAWNIWQMDGLKGVVPYSCHEEQKVIVRHDLLDGTITEVMKVPCPGCKVKKNFANVMHLHNGIFCKIRDWTLVDWTRNKAITFVSLVKRDK